MPHEVRWMPVDGGPAGISIDGHGRVLWPKLQMEIMQRLLTQVSELNEILPRCRVVLKDFGIKKNWFVRITDTQANEIGAIWFGANPEVKGLPFDGLVRVGKSFDPPEIWAVFQRFSDGSYRRLPHAPASTERVAPFKTNAGSYAESKEDRIPAIREGEGEPRSITRQRLSPKRQMQDDVYVEVLRDGKYEAGYASPQEADTILSEYQYSVVCDERNGLFKCRPGKKDGPTRVHDIPPKPRDMAGLTFSRIGKRLDYDKIARSFGFANLDQGVQNNRIHRYRNRVEEEVLGKKLCDIIFEKGKNRGYQIRKNGWSLCWVRYEKELASSELFRGLEPSENQ